MGVSWHSPRSRSASSRNARALVAGIRRLATLGLAAPSSVGRRQVELSEHAHALETLRRLHKIAAEGGDCIAVRHDEPSAALTSGALADAPLSLPPASAPVDRAPVHDPASSVWVAAQHAARSLP